MKSSVSMESFIYHCKVTSEAFYLELLRINFNILQSLCQSLVLDFFFLFKLFFFWISFMDGMTHGLATMSSSG